MRNLIAIAIIGLSSATASGQTVTLPVTEGAQLEAGDALYAAQLDDCLRRYRTLHARSNMLPSERRRAIERCRSMARAEAFSLQLAARLVERSTPRD